MITLRFATYEDLLALQDLIPISVRALSQGYYSAEQIESSLYNAYGQRQISTIYTDVNEYWVVMEVLPQFQRDPSGLAQLYVRSSGGNFVPLSTVAKLTRTI